MRNTGPYSIPARGTLSGVTVSPSSSAQRARHELAARLRDIRLDAGLSAQDLSAAAGWHPSKTSRIENARQTLADDDIKAWCRVCGTDDQAPDLIAASRTADSMYAEWRRLHLVGMRRTQEARVPLYERTRLMRAYCSTVMPGGSWASASYNDTGAGFEIRQHGRCLWDQVENAYFRWLESGSPGRDRYGLTVTPEGQHLWLDHPRNVITGSG